MVTVLITGLAGTGKRVVQTHLQHAGYSTVDLSDAAWSTWKRVRPMGSEEAGPRDEWVWQEDHVADLLAHPPEQPLLAFGCAENQGMFHDRFDRIILLTATPERMIERLEPRWDLRIATDRFERYQLLESVREVLPRLREAADLEIDTTNRGVEEIIDLILHEVEAARCRSIDHSTTTKPTRQAPAQ
jgi:broad-specificity NMP kinase